MAALEPEEFVQRHLLGGLGMVFLVAGEDFALGRARRGTIAHLAELGKRLGFGVEGVPLLVEEGKPITSSRIRELLGAGRVAEAARLLGRPYRLDGQVVTGRGLGRELGFPTANLLLLEHRLLPADGIYAARVLLESEPPRAGALSIGMRPSVGGGPRTVEVHVLDFAGDLRGRTLTLDLLDWLREERHYPTLEALAAAIEEDVRHVRALWAARPPG
jgi:riboflavin kinase/FMN adenylyltransferase